MAINKLMGRGGDQTRAMNEKVVAVKEIGDARARERMEQLFTGEKNADLAHDGKSG